MCDGSRTGADLIGVNLMRAAFSVEGGPLTDMTAERGERVGRVEFFAGAIGSYKNPHSHRDVNLDDPYEALEIILLANHSLRIVDARARARRGTNAMNQLAIPKEPGALVGLTMKPPAVFLPDEKTGERFFGFFHRAYSQPEHAAGVLQGSLSVFGLVRGQRALALRM